jgi:type II secretory pathway pseudopilin PulG
MSNHFHQSGLQISNRSSDRVGLSLLELLVVLTILIALGGIVVSTLPGMLRRTQVATAAANVPEIESTIRRMAVLSQGQIGNRFDSLISGSAAIDGAIPEYIGGSEIFESTTLSAVEVEALRLIGITELVPANGEAENATFGSHDQIPVPVGTDTRVCSLGTEAITLLIEDWNLQPSEGSRYYVFGLGEQCSIVGAGEKASFAEAPVHFSDERDQSPEEMYSRYLLLVEVKPISETESVARYIGAAIPGKNGIRSVSTELEAHYSNQEN